MNLLLYIQALSQNEFKYNNPTLSLIKEEFKAYTILDIDNLSEQDLLQYCSMAIAESEKLIVIFEGNPNADIGNLGVIIRVAAKSKNLTLPLGKSENSLLCRSRFK